MSACGTAIRWGLLVAALLLTACGGGTGAARPVALLSAGGEAAGAASLSSTSGDFALKVSPETFLGAEPAGVFSLAAASDGDEVVATIEVVGAVSLRALYCELGYDASQFTPLGVEHLPMATGAAGSGADEPLTLTIMDQPGTVHIGQVLADWQQRAGLTGARELARVRFVRRPVSTGAVRTVSVALESVDVDAQLRVDSELKRLWWQYKLPGDFNQDSIVGVSDLTPLGQHYEEQGEIVGYSGNYPDRYPIYAFDPGTIQRVVDGNGDGLIGVSDITVIGHSFGLQVDGYRVFASADLSDYPGTGADSDSALEVADIPVSMMGGQTAGQRFFRLPFPILQTGWYYWLRPYNETETGGASNYGLFAPALADDFELELQPETFFEGGQLSDVRLYFAEDEDQILIDVWVEGAVALKALSGWLHFDSDRYRPTGLFVATATRAGSEVDLSGISVYPAQLEGRLLVCTTRSLGNLDGFIGDWHVCTLTLQRGMQDELTQLRPEARSIYGVAQTIQYDPVAEELRWPYPGVGDADQDGLTLNDDMLMLSYYMDMWAQDAGMLGTDIPAHMDMNMDGFVHVSDITVLANNFGNAVDGFNIYASADPADIPQPVERDELHLLVIPEHLQIGQVPFAAGEGDALRERLLYGFNVPDPQPGQWLWLMPTWQGQVGNVVRFSEIQIPQE